MGLVQQKVLNNLLVLALYCPEFYNNCQVKIYSPVWCCYVESTCKLACIERFLKKGEKKKVNYTE